MAIIEHPKGSVVFTPTGDFDNKCCCCCKPSSYWTSLSNSNPDTNIPKLCTDIDIFYLRDRICICTLDYAGAQIVKVAFDIENLKSLHKKIGEVLEEYIDETKN